MSDNVKDLIADARKAQARPWEFDIPTLLEALRRALEAAQDPHEKTATYVKYPAKHLRVLANDVAYTGGHAAVMRAAADHIDSLEAAHSNSAGHDRQVQIRTLEQFGETLGVDVGDEDSEWWQGYRQGQRNALHMTTRAAEAFRKEGEGR